MSVTETVRAMLQAAENGDFDTAAGYLADDFVFSGPVPKPIGKDQWLGLQKVMLAAFPDWSFNLSDVREEGNVATTTHFVSGTHTGELDLSALGLPKVPATGKSFKLPVEHAKCVVEGGKITNLHIADVSPEGGVPGILKQLGVAMPPPPG